MATIIDIYGTYFPLTNLSFASLQAAVGGDIERITLSDGSAMYINGNGKCEGLPFNEEATRLARSVLGAEDFIVGNVVLWAFGEGRNEDNEPDEQEDE